MNNHGHIQELEGRRLLSVSLASTGTVVAGGSNKDDVIEVFLSDADTLTVARNGRERDYDVDLVERVIVRGGNGADLIAVDGDVYADIRAILYGNNGDDTLVGGDGDDRLYGNNGDDVLDGHGGDDYLNGHNGDDELAGGAGEDTLVGENGDDLLVGGPHFDRLIGGRGENTFDDDAADVVSGGSRGNGEGEAKGGKDKRKDRD